MENIDVSGGRTRVLSREGARSNDGRPARPGDEPRPHLAHRWARLVLSTSGTRL